ncbi:hypothetical protein ANO11243_040620 [Dothideomycetidae sp. 11243]|nr:hypothetical protein ANO11243_040620 [fungal sp. No.11243]
MPVPSPTPTYFKYIDAGPPTMLASPQRLLLILDLNGVLIHRNRNGDPRSFKTRPGAHSFLEHCFANHDVMIWTSTRKENADSILERLLTPDQSSSLVEAWFRENFNLSPLHFRENVQVYKCLSWVWQHYKFLIPDFGAKYGPHNTLLVDDSTRKAATEPYNLCHVETWDGKDQNDTELGKALMFISETACMSDVARYRRWRGQMMAAQALDAASALAASKGGLEVGDEPPVGEHSEDDDQVFPEP